MKKRGSAADKCIKERRVFLRGTANANEKTPSLVLRKESQKNAWLALCTLCTSVHCNGSDTATELPAYADMQGNPPQSLYFTV